MTITPVYAGLLALIFVLLSLRVIRIRRSTGTALGHGDDKRLLRHLRAHANFAEYAPLAIVLMALIEWQEAPGLLLHVIGVCLLGGRLLHAFGVSREPETYKFRVTGMALTFTALIIGALANLVLVGFSMSQPA